jgi:hypothetical protein
MKNVACNSTKQKLSTMIFGFTLLLMSVANVSFAKDVTLTWDPSPSPETDVAGYKIYYGTNTGTYTGTEATNTGTSPVDFGKETIATLEGLDDTKSHYFTVTAYNANGEESAYANEVTAPPSTVDIDGDTYTVNQGDCDDKNPDINPGATDICGKVDQNCDKVIDACPVDPNDTDNDIDGYTENQGDCNDNKPTINPGATDICGDSIDQDCSGADAVCPADPIELVSPIGGEKWSSSSPQTTAWKVSDTPSLVDTVVIEYSKNDQSWKTLKTMSGKQAQANSTEVVFPTTRKSKKIKVKVTVKNAQGVVMGTKNSEPLTLTR